MPSPKLTSLIPPSRASLPTALPSALPAALLASLLAVASATSQQFVVLEKSHGDLPSPQTGDGIAADFDLDGTVDILLRRGSLIRNDGSLGFEWDPPGGTIPLSVNLPFPQRFHHVTDVDGDGFVDLVVNSLAFLPAQSEIRVLFGSAQGTFAPEVLVGSTPGFGLFRAIFDADGDGLEDIFIGGGTTFVMMQNAGNGTFVDVSASNLPAGHVGYPIASADVDGDGDEDLLTASNGVPLEILVNDGSGVFSVLPGTGLSSYFLAPEAHFGDTDGDGDVDLMIFPSNGTPTELLENSGQGVFAAIGTTLPVSRFGRLLQDFDGDGDADLVVVDVGEMTTWENQAGSFVQRQSLSLEGDQLGDPVLADLDADSDLDLVVGGSLLFLNDGFSDFSPLRRRSVPHVEQGGSLAVGDLDGDGNIDLMHGRHALRNEGNGFFEEAAQFLPVDAAARALFDADGDGDLDVVWTTRDNPIAPAQDCGIAINNGAMSFSVTFLPSGSLVGDVIAADFDNDGLTDLVSEGGTVVQNNGTGNFALVGSVQLGNGPLTTADFDGDGLLDVVIGNNAGFSYWRNQGNLQFQLLVNMPAPAPTSLASGDVDADGDPDLVFATFSSSGVGNIASLQVWTNDQGLLSLDSFYLSGGTAIPSLAIADVDEDGDQDLVADRVWVNDGTGTFADAMRGITAYGDLAVADLDRDGDPDVIQAGENLAGVFVNRHRHLGARRFPILAQPYDIVLAVQPGYGVPHIVAPALASARIPATPLPPLGVLHIDPNASVLGDAGITDANGEYRLTITVPNNPALAGAELVWQGVTVETNGLRLTGFVHDVVLR